MKTKVQILREEKHLTQTELAEKSGLSLRTIQRIEAGNIPKGFTLKALAKSFEVEPENLILNSEIDPEIKRAKLINFSALSSLIIPFGNIIFPSILTYKSTEPKAKELGKSILTVQIIYTFVLGILMIISPFIQKAFAIKFPLFIIFLVLLKIINIFIIFKNAFNLTHKSDLYIKLKYSIL
ncbi:helix-turn-helix domain-containing protein [Flavobacterium defluvii]|uniref:DNA-binding transcriptional regulator, XRE-family HTH domain n=1 Tax=Flavobacterium defluvii TaxID=370979 RepID=A0A1M5TS21_9FLAO|nr:helix-turn-helix domain-containing protein [Flavobacterium defluvii]SHH53509.1 DNA-binding transcriptional regulator, XRE-family HTH domain [Flavobacterium defluvii]